MRLVWAAVAVAVAAGGAVCGSAAPAAGVVSATQADYGIRLIGPLDRDGVATRARVVAGAPFLLELVLSTDVLQGGASVAYDIDLPTGVRGVVKPRRAAAGSLTSSCLRACSVGWDTARTRRLVVYYRFVTPGPGEFIIEARLVATNRSDTRAGNDTGSLTIVATAPRLTLGLPRLAAGVPVAGRVFRVTVPIRRGGEPVRPTGAVCAAAIGARELAASVSTDRGAVGCAWMIPPGSAGRTLQTTVRATEGSLAVSGSWLYAIQKP